MFEDIQHLSCEDFSALIKDKKVWNLDVREKAEYESGHIPGACLVPSTWFDEEFKKLGIKKTDKIAVYCRSGSRSAFIANKLLEMGYKNVFNLELGILDWEKNGGEITK